MRRGPIVEVLEIGELTVAAVLTAAAPSTEEERRVDDAPAETVAVHA